MGKLISNLITLGFILATFHTLGEVTHALKKGAAKQEMMSLGQLNRSLHAGRWISKAENRRMRENDWK